MARRVLGNDPFKRGAAERLDVPAAPPPATKDPRRITPARPATPEMQVSRAGLKGPTRPVPAPRPGKSAPAPHEGSIAPSPHADVPRIGADPTPHAGSPSVAPSPHADAPRISADPTPHAGVPVAVPLQLATPHAGSPTVTPVPQGAPPRVIELGPLPVEARAHAGSPTAVEEPGPRAHGGSPRLPADPTPHAGIPRLSPDLTPHAGTPRATPLVLATPHSGSPTLAPTPHADAPSGTFLGLEPSAHAASPAVVADPTAHEGSPEAIDLEPAMQHAGSPSVRADFPASTQGEAAPLPGTIARTPAPALTASVGSSLRGLARVARTAIGLSSRETRVDPWGKDESLSRSLRPLADLLYDRYWRVRVEGVANVPTGPCIIVANHAGALPLDGPVLHLALRRERPELAESRWLLEDQIFHAPFIGVLANRLGAVRASPENAYRLLEEGRPLIVFPEGFHGLSKPFAERYQLRRFGRGGYAKIALKAMVPVVPAAIVGGEESMPLLGKLPGAPFGVQYLPLTVPPLPARWHIRFAPPLRFDDAPPDAENDINWVTRTNEQVRDLVQGMLTTMLRERTKVF